jgi:hypothetical protein
MKVQRVFGSFIFGMVMVVFLLLILSQPQGLRVKAAPDAKALYVLDDGGSDTGDCTDSQNPCKTIQYALLKAGPGDTIYVANKSFQTVYTGPITITKPNRLEGGWNVTSTPSGLMWNRSSPCEAFRTVIDAQGTWRAVTFSSSPYQPSIDCFTITGGDGALHGGGIYGKDVSPIITNNVITKNYGASTDNTHIGLGGGIYLENADTGTLIRGNRIENNIANMVGTGKGGGIYCKSSEVEIQDNIIKGNTASPTGTFGEGGGVFLGNVEDASVISNIIESNIAGYNQDGNGGGIYLDDPDNLIIYQNEINENFATWAGSNGYGGGIYINGGDAYLSSNFFANNAGAGFPGFPSTATGVGGGAAISNSVTTINFNQFRDNTGTNGVNSALGVGGGIYGYQGTLNINNNDFIGNQATNSTSPGSAGIGGGVYLEEVFAWLKNNTFNANMAIGSIYGVGGGVRINFCPVYTVTNNIIVRNEANTKGSGLAIYSSTGTLIHNTIAQNNQGDGIGVLIQNSGAASLINTIIVSHTMGISVETGASATMRATLWGAGSWANLTDWGGGGSLIRSIDIWGDPAFAAPG